MEKQAAKGDFLRLGFVRLLLSFYWEQGALFFVLGLSAGHLCAKTVGGMLIQFSPGISRRLCYLCGMLILTLRGDRYAIGKEPGKAEPFREYGTPQQAGTAPDRRAGTAFLETCGSMGGQRGQSAPTAATSPSCGNTCRRTAIWTPPFSPAGSRNCWSRAIPPAP